MIFKRKQQVDDIELRKSIEQVYADVLKNMEEMGLYKPEGNSDQTIIKRLTRKH